MKVFTMSYTSAINPNPAPADPEASGEVKIERTIQFKESTFTGLKTFIRQQTRITGATLTNAAAVDQLLREALVRRLHPDAVATMNRGAAGRAVASRAPRVALRATSASPSMARLTPPGSIIGISVSKARALVTPVNGGAA